MKHETVLRGVTILSFEEFVNEAENKIKKYADVKVGDIAIENSNGKSNKIGKIIWKGNHDQLKKSKFKSLDLDWADSSPAGFHDDDKIWNEYNLVVVDVEGSRGVPTLYNYDRRPSECIVFEK